MKKYDYLIVGAGLFGAVFAHEATRRGKTCLVNDKRGHIGGNIYTEEVEGIQVHRYGAHIFHTSRKQVWDYINQFAEFNHFVNSPIAVYKDELYNLPFNMTSLIDHKACFPPSCGLMCKYCTKKAGSYYQIIIFLQSGYKSTIQRNHRCV